MTNKSQLGRLGEDAGCEYLVKKGYKIISRNFRQKWGELDIIAVAPDKTLVFVEVKTMTDSINGIKPEDQLTGSKLRKLKRMASLYANHYPELVNDDKGWQIDLLAITVKGDIFDIKHYENIS